MSRTDDGTRTSPSARLERGPRWTQRDVELMRGCLRLMEQAMADARAQLQVAEARLRAGVS
jgi:hypothetical protein